MRITPPPWRTAKIYVDGDLLPPYMGVSVDPTPASISALAFLHQPHIIEPHEQGATWLTKLVCRQGNPWKYIPICRLSDVSIRIEIEEKTLVWQT